MAFHLGSAGLSTPHDLSHAALLLKAKPLYEDICRSQGLSQLRMRIDESHGGNKPC